MYRQHHLAANHERYVWASPFSPHNQEARKPTSINLADR